MPVIPAGLGPGGRIDAWTAPVPRLVVCDVDGTLIGPGHHVGEGVAEAVLHLQALGIHVGVSTGRPWAGLGLVVEPLGLAGHHVLHNGAEVRDGTGRIVHTEAIAPDAVERLVATTVAHGWYTEVYAGDGWWVSDEREVSHIHAAMLGADPSGLIDQLDLGDADVPRVMLTSSRAEVPALLSTARDQGLSASTALAPATPDLVFVSVTRRGTDKGSGVRHAAAAAELELDRIAAIGDAANDMPMLGLVGTGIAMGQAEADVRAGAHLVAPDVADRGAASALAALGRLGDRRAA